MNGKLTQLAPATAANGTNRPMMGGNLETAARRSMQCYLTWTRRYPTFKSQCSSCCSLKIDPHQIEFDGISTDQLTEVATA